MLESGPPIPVVPVASEVTTVGQLFQERARRSGTRAALYEKHDGRWWKVTWREFYERAAAVARGLIEMGLEPGDKVAILGSTKVAWCIYDMGAQLAGLVSLGIYPKLSTHELQFIVENSDTRVILVEDAKELETVLEAVNRSAQVQAIVPWTESLFAQYEDMDQRLRSPSVLEGRPAPSDLINARLASRQPEDTAILVYTSGTTGPPKGVMTTNKNIISFLRQHTDKLQVLQSDISLSFLPMSHAAERVLGFYGRIDMGIPTAYASSIPAVLEELGEVQPTLFGSVPRIFEKAYDKIQGQLANQSKQVQRLFAWALRVGVLKSSMEREGRRVPWRLEAKYLVADKLVFKKVRQAFGGRIRFFITGAAPISREILDLFWAAGMPVYDVYGLTETTTITHANYPGATKLGTVGRPIGDTACKIAEDGELWVKGDLIFKGYYKNPEATQEAMEGDWFKTGDICKIDDEGYLTITDRKKHIIITAGGKNLSPANIEREIKRQDPLISQVHAHGDRRNYVSAIVTPNAVETLNFGRKHGVLEDSEVEALFDELRADPTGQSERMMAALAKVVTLEPFIDRVARAVGAGNRELARVEKVRRFTILDRDFSHDFGEMTPSMKMVRRVIEEQHAETFDRIYNEDGFALEPRS